MLRYVMLCYVMLCCYVLLCYVMLCCYVMLRYFMLCYVVLLCCCVVMLCCCCCVVVVVLWLCCHVLSCHVMSCHVMLCYYLANRGYDRNFLKTQTQRASDIHQSEALKNTMTRRSETIPFVITYNPTLPNLTSIIHKHSNILHSSDRCKTFSRHFLW